MKTFRQLREQLVQEGNPLARLTTFAGEGTPETSRHYIAISAQRNHLTPQEGALRHVQLGNAIRAHGYGYHQVAGTYEGTDEPSYIVPAMGVGTEAGERLLSHAKGWASLFGSDDMNTQDSVFYHNGEAGHLIGTNNTGFPGKGITRRLGKVHFNDVIEDQEFKTEFDPQRSPEHRRKFASVDLPPPKKQQ